MSFDAAVSSFTPEAFPIASRRVLLSPYWGDVDTRTSDGGFVYYRNTTDSILLTKATSQVRTLFPAFSNFTPTFLFIATWDHVGYFAQHTEKVNESCFVLEWWDWSCMYQSHVLSSLESRMSIQVDKTI